MPFQDNEVQYAKGLEIYSRAFAALSTLVLPLKKKNGRKRNMVFKIYVSGKIMTKMRKYAKAIKLF